MVAFTAEEVFKRRSSSFTPFDLKAAVRRTCRAELSAVSIETSLEIVSLFYPLRLLIPANKNYKKKRRGGRNDKFKELWVEKWGVGY